MVKKKKPSRGAHKVALEVIASVILTALVVSIVNVGLSIFLESPEYSDFCDKRFDPGIDTREECESVGGKWNPNGVQKPTNENNQSGSCDVDFTCSKEYDQARDDYEQMRYYVFAVIGFALILLGIFNTMKTVQYSGLSSGGILLLQGIVTNFRDKVTVFVSLLIILIVFGYLVYRKIEKD